MTNQRFAEYSRSQAFGLSLSLRQVQCLLFVSYVSDTPAANRKLSYPHMHFGTYGSLCTKGLIEWRPSETCSGQEGPYVTRAGKLLCALLKEAGYSLTADDLAVTSKAG